LIWGGVFVDNKIAEVRMSLHMSQAQLAQSVGISRVYVSNVERGVNDPNATVAKRLCKVLGKTFEELFPDGAVSPPKPAYVDKWSF
jgi:putative transcriptional regulator